MPPRHGYLPLLEQLDAWQHDAARRNPGVIPCRPGCDHCCRGPFDVSIADAAAVIDAVRALPADALVQVRRLARSHVDAMTAIEPGWSAPFDIAAIGDARFDRISDRLAELPCPLLDERGGCRIYSARPMVCRLMGLGMVVESGDVIENGCPIQDRFPEYAALAPEPFPLERWERDDEREKVEAARRFLHDESRADFETTIAAAIVTWVAGPEAEVTPS